MGHSLGAAFHTPHGRAVGLMLPYTIEFTAAVTAERYADLARFLGINADTPQEAAQLLASKIRDLARSVQQPISLQGAGIDAEEFETQLPRLVNNAENDATLVASARIPDHAELERLYRYVFAGQPVDF